MSMKNEEEICGKVTPEERNEIKNIYTRKIALVELFGMIDPENQAMYNKLVEDMGNTTLAYQKWFEDRSRQYSWPSARGGKWRVDFDTCEVFLA